jgi:sugar phosphate isomerase/epimerase
MKTRRNFLKQGATLGTGLALANSSLAADEKMTGPKLEGRIFKALKGGQKGGETPEAFFGRLRSLGFDGVESGNPAKSEAYRAAAEKTGIRVHGLVNGGHWGVRLSDPDAAVREKGRKNLERHLVSAHRLGGSSVLLAK